MKRIWFQKDFAKNSVAGVVVLIVAALGIHLLTASHAATGAGFSMSVSSTTVAPGSDVSVTINEDSGSTPVNTVEVGINYDTSQLEYKGMNPGTVFTNSAQDSESSGDIRYSGGVEPDPDTGKASSVTGSNQIVTLTFHVKATNGTTVPITFNSQYTLLASFETGDNISESAPALNLNVSDGSGGGGGGGPSDIQGEISLAPASGTFVKDSLIYVRVFENGNKITDGTPVFVNKATAKVNYDSSQLMLTDVQDNSVFPTKSPSDTDTSTAGQVTVTRAVQPGTDPSSGKSYAVAGTNTIVTLTFKVLSDSGTATLSVDKAASSINNESDNTNTLYDVKGAVYNLVASQSDISGTMSLSTSGSTYTQGSIVTVALKESSSTSQIDAVHPFINFPTNDLDYLGTTPFVDPATNKPTWPNNLTTKLASPGVLEIDRGVAGGSDGFAGTNTVVYISFKVKTTSANVNLSFASNSAMWDNSGSGLDIFDAAHSTGTSFTINGSTPAGSGVLSLAPSSGTVQSAADNGTLSVTVNVTSTTDQIGRVETVLNYPVDKLTYVSEQDGSIFTVRDRTRNDATNGQLDIIRRIPAGTAGQTGTQGVMTLNFAVKAASGSIPLNFDSYSAVYGTDDATNIINFPATSANNGTYTVAGSTSCTDSPTTPGAPTKASASYSQVSIAWAASTAGSNCTLAGYDVYRGGTLLQRVTSGTSFTDTDLQSGQTYNYTVVAVDQAGHSSASSPVGSVSTKADDVSPETPTGIRASAPDAASVVLNWDPSSDLPVPGAVGVAGYHVYRNGDTSPTYTVPSGTSYTDTNVVASTTYTYTVAAFDNNGNESAPSSIVSIKTAAPSCSGTPSVPGGLTAGATTVSSTSFSWTASNASPGCTLAGYKVYRGSQLVGSTTDPSFTDSGLNPGTAYTYTVRSYDTSSHNSGLSTALNISTASDTEDPTAPASVTASALSAGQVQLSWTASTDNVTVAGYKVYRDGQSIAQVTSTSFLDTTVVGNHDYNYEVTAIDEAQNESSKTAAQPSPVHTPDATDKEKPSKPDGLGVDLLTTSSVAFSWNDSTDNVGVVGYHVYRDGKALPDTSEPSFVDDGLKSGTTYNYTVAAYDASGNVSDVSDTLTVSTKHPFGEVIGDLDGDGKVTEYDLSTLLSHMDQSGVPPEYGDIVPNGKVDEEDLSALLTHLGDPQ